MPAEGHVPASANPRPFARLLVASHGRAPFDRLFASRLRSARSTHGSTTSSTSAETIELFKQYVVPNYSRYPVALVRGEGSYVWDAEGKRYLDFFPGWGCNLLGHCPEPVVGPCRSRSPR